MIEPISPSEITYSLPEFVIIGTNNCINKHWRPLKKESHFLQDELITEILAVAPEGVTRNTLFDKCWLDVEPTYEKKGWNVEYDKPDWNDPDGKASFTFTPKK